MAKKKVQEVGGTGSLFRVCVIPRDGGKPVFERIVIASGPVEAKQSLGGPIAKAIEKSSLKIRDTKTTADKVTDIK